MKRLFKLLLLAGVALGIYQLVQAKKAEWEGLTESEVRAKLDAKLSSRVPEEKLSTIQDNVVGKMRAMGKLAEDEASPEVSDAAETA